MQVSNSRTGDASLTDLEIYVFSLDTIKLEFSVDDDDG